MVEVIISEKTRNDYRTESDYVGILRCWVWCFENFGPPGYKKFNPQECEWRWDWDAEKKFSFANEQDALMFKLLWS